MIPTENYTIHEANTVYAKLTAVIICASCWAELRRNVLLLIRSESKRDA